MRAIQIASVVLGAVYSAITGDFMTAFLVCISFLIVTEYMRFES